MKHNIDKHLSRMKIKPLTKEERGRVWQHIVSRANQPLPSSHFMIKEFIQKPLVWGTMIVLLIFGSSVATVSAADNAKPGDLLYSIDRALESVQLALASSNQQKTQLKLGMVQERLEEIQAILAENETDDIEDVEENTQNNNNNAGETNFSIDEEQIDQAFDIALSSIATIKQEFEDQGNTDAVSAIDKVIAGFDTDFDSLPSKFKFSIKQNRNKYQLTLEIQTSEGRERLKIKTNGDKVDIDLKNEDGKIKVKVKEDGSVKLKNKGHGNGRNGEDEEEEDDEEDTTPLAIETLSPADNATEVALDTNLIITFSEDVIASSGTIAIKKAIDDSIVETINAASTTNTGGDTITISLLLNLASDTEYYVHIDAGTFEDTATNAYEGIADTTTWSFTTVDTIAPVISLIVSETTASTTAIITWTTDESADSAVAYGTSTPVTTDSPFIVVSDTNFLENHSIDLVGLVASTTYNFIAISKDAVGNKTVSDEDSFTTLSF